MVDSDTLDELAGVLSIATQEDDGLLLSEFDGFCTALAIGPEMILPSEWLPVVWGGDGSPIHDGPNGLQRSLDLIMRHYNAVVEGLTPPQASFAPVYDIDECTGDILWATWVSGFERAMRLRPDAWADIYEQTQGTEYEEVGLSVGMMLELAALDYGTSTLTDEQAAILAEDVPEAIAEIVFIIQDWTYSKYKPAPYPAMTTANMPMPPRTSPKVGRNEPCPCGSGRKYKKCCGAN